MESSMLSGMLCLTPSLLSSLPPPCLLPLHTYVIISKILVQEGASGLYRGLLTSLIKMTPAHAVSPPLPSSLLSFPSPFPLPSLFVCQPPPLLRPLISSLIHSDILYDVRVYPPIPHYDPPSRIGCLRDTEEREHPIHLPPICMYPLSLFPFFSPSSLSITIIYVFYISLYIY